MLKPNKIKQNKKKETTNKWNLSAFLRKKNLNYRKKSELQKENNSFQVPKPPTSTEHFSHIFSPQFFSLVIAIFFLRLCTLTSNCHGCEEARFKALCRTKKQLYKIAQVFTFTFKSCSLRKCEEVSGIAKCS